MSRQALPKTQIPNVFSILTHSGYLLLLFVIALCLTFLLASGNVTAGVLFQSPQSPPVEQPPVEQPPVEQPPVEQPPVEQPPVEQPPVEQPPVEQPPVEQPPAQQPAAEQTSTQQSPLVPTAPQSPLEQPVPQTGVQESLPPINTGGEEPVAETGSGDLTLDRAELIDSVVVSGAYIWLCCGVILLLFIPFSLLLLYIRGRSKIVQEEDF